MKSFKKRLVVLLISTFVIKSVFATSVFMNPKNERGLKVFDPISLENYQNEQIILLGGGGGDVGTLTGSGPTTLKLSMHKEQQSTDGTWMSNESYTDKHALKNRVYFDVYFQSCANGPLYNLSQAPNQQVEIPFQYANPNACNPFAGGKIGKYYIKRIPSPEPKLFPTAGTHKAIATLTATNGTGDSMSMWFTVIDNVPDEVFFVSGGFDNQHKPAHAGIDNRNHVFSNTSFKMGNLSYESRNTNREIDINDSFGVTVNSNKNPVHLALKFPENNGHDADHTWLSYDGTPPGNNTNLTHINYDLYYQPCGGDSSTQYNLSQATGHTVTIPVSESNYDACRAGMGRLFVKRQQFADGQIPYPGTYHATIYLVATAE